MSQIIKITDLIKNKVKLSYSFEVTPDIKKVELDNFEGDPVFYSVTWHAKSHQCTDLNIEPLRLVSYLKSKNKHALLHLSCDLLMVEYLEKLLEKLQELGVCNLFLVLGEAYDPSKSEFRNTSELIKFIRKTTGQYFCIGIAGFPDGSEEKLLILKEKIEYGADFVITQAFFDAKLFRTFKDRCIENGITVPIIPGIFPFDSYKQFHGFVNLCKIKISNDLLEKIQVYEKSNESCSKLINSLILEVSKNETTHFHFFTLNKLQNSYEIIKPLL